MFGGGSFSVQNKILNGTYINFVSTNKVSINLADRGVATMPLELDWGVDGAVFEVTPYDFEQNSMKVFGYHYDHEKLKGLRDLFMNIKTLYAYKLTSGGAKATNDFATAKYTGVRGNALNIVISTNVDEPEKFDVRVFMETSMVYEQFAVTSAADLKPNDFVDWNTGAVLTVTAGTKLSGGTNGVVDGTAHKTYLNKIESYSYNTMGAVVTDDTTKGVYAAFVERMRDQLGAKFQCVLHNCPANYEGVINVKSDAVDSDSVANLVYWVTGAEAGCAVNKTLMNQRYTGEFTVDVDHTQSELEFSMQNGEFVFHNVKGEVRVLADINSFAYGTVEKPLDVFGDNQCVRVMDKIANDIAVIFNTKYLGQVPNNAAGRISLWNDIVKHHNQLQDINAIQDFDANDVTVNQGNTKSSVVIGDAITIMVGMAKLYMTVTVQ